MSCGLVGLDFITMNKIKAENVGAAIITSPPSLAISHVVSGGGWTDQLSTQYIIKRGMSLHYCVFR